jgi:hypothetical protein
MRKDKFIYKSQIYLINNMMKTILLPLLLFLIVINCVMDFYDGKLKVQNNSNETISVMINPNYPDTSLENATGRDFIYSGEFGTFHLPNYKWGRIFKRNEKITIFLINENSLRKARKMILTKSDLDSLDWIIKYP